MELFYVGCRASGLHEMNSLTIVMLTGSETDCRLTKANGFLHSFHGVENCDRNSQD